jgi:endo-1,4-beta-xylanase
MRSRSNLVLSMSVGVFTVYCFGCGATDADEDLGGGLGGSSADAGGSVGGTSGSGGTAATGGSIPATGGTLATGGVAPTGGLADTGGTEPAGGGSTTGGRGGRSVTGGETSTGGRSGAGGETSAEPTGGRSTGGRSGRGATGGETSTGGRSAAGGETGAGGTEPTGGTTDNGGSPGGVVFPKKFAGNIDTRNQIRSDFAEYWDQFSPENAGKWGSTQPNSQSEFNWRSLDAMHDYCVQNNIVFKEHCFVWGSQQPNWVNDGNGEAAVKNWMTEFCKRYPDVAMIDVVNEPPPHTTPAYRNGIGGDGASGWDWIANAFKWAREACPNAVLILNDYNNIELSGDARHTVDIVKAIQSVNAPIDAIGCQTHGTDNAQLNTLQSNLDTMISGTGLPIYITEFDINIADDSRQAQVMRDQFTMFWENTDIKGVTLWGYIVGATWLQNTGLMQDNGTMRPAMTWLMQYLGRG